MTKDQADVLSDSHPISGTPAEDRPPVRVEGRPTAPESQYPIPENYRYPELDTEHIFSYHESPDEETTAKYQRIRAAAKNLALVIEADCPRCADTTAAIRKVREAVMTANAAIALRGRLTR